VTVRVVLVRHAQPEASADVAPGRWPLSASGRRAAEQLRGRLPASGRWVASTEVKAYETLVAAGPRDAGAIARDARFGEVRRSEPYDVDFRTRRRAWVEGRLDERHAGWETPLEAAARFDAAVEEHAEPGDPLVVGSHGMVITAWLVHARGTVTRQEAGAFWTALAFPDVIEVRSG
jgi:broad specificity phosphatase PhoE